MGTVFREYKIGEGGWKPRVRGCVMIGVGLAIVLILLYTLYTPNQGANKPTKWGEDDHIGVKGNTSTGTNINVSRGGRNTSANAPTPWSNYVSIKDGYFWDPTENGGRGGYWLPHGIAYQTWNAALGQWQDKRELETDLSMMEGMGANAIRVDFVWKHIETKDNVFNWSRYDMLLEEAKKRGLRVFALVGYQWPPDWFPDEWYTLHPPYPDHPEGEWKSDIIRYENPEVRKQFRDFLQAVASRYSAGGEREDLGDVIAAWIVGNEYGYLGLWSNKYDGYDADSKRAFRKWLSEKYGDIAALNKKWKGDNEETPGYLPHYPYKDFSEVDMPTPFKSGANGLEYIARDKASWYDLTEWREESIAEFVATGAEAIKRVDPHHLVSYSSVGMQWGEEDERYHTEDVEKIAEACRRRGAPLDFWSINNYPWGLMDDELATGKWGIERALHHSKLPVMLTETGFTDTETMYPGMNRTRQARLLKNAIWEALESGAIGVCVFHWSDREAWGLTKREVGFGIVDTKKKPKPAYYAVREAFEAMDRLNISQYLVNSKPRPADIAFFWDDATDTILLRYQAEMKGMFGTLERLGFKPTFINRRELKEGDYKKYKAIVFPRNQKMFNDVFSLLNEIAKGGTKIHANADLPGIMDEYGHRRNRGVWEKTIKGVFGIDVSDALVDKNLWDDDHVSEYESPYPWKTRWESKVLYSDEIPYNRRTSLWKYRDNIKLAGGKAIAWFDRKGGAPAVVVNGKEGGCYSTAISLFGIGDAWFTWKERYEWLDLIYRKALCLKPSIYVSNPYILADYRTGGGKILLGIHNYRPDEGEEVKIKMGALKGKRVVNLLEGGVVSENCNGTIQIHIEPEDHIILLAS